MNFPPNAPLLLFCANGKWIRQWNIFWHQKTISVDLQPYPRKLEPVLQLLATVLWRAQSWYQRHDAWVMKKIEKCSVPLSSGCVTLTLEHVVRLCDRGFETFESKGFPLCQETFVSKSCSTNFVDLFLGQALEDFNETRSDEFRAQLEWTGGHFFMKPLLKPPWKYWISRTLWPHGAASWWKIWSQFSKKIN